MATPLTTPDALSAYLTAHSQPHTTISLLTGGTANFVYRVTLPDNSTLIYKHAAPHLHSNPSFAFDPARMDFEDRALERLPQLIAEALSSDSADGKDKEACNVRAIKWQGYDKEAKLLCIEDGGSANLKTAYDDSELEIPSIGQHIGRWLAALHFSTVRTSLAADGVYDEQHPEHNNNPIAVAIYRYSYINLASALEQFGEDRAFGERINDEFGSRLAHEDDHVCHGDFWPGNVLVCQNPEGETVLMIVDWEMARRGTGATDVGQFAAEAFLLDRFKGGKGLCATFLNAYAKVIDEARRNGRKVFLGREWMRRMVVHWGTHVAFWPTRVEWTDKEGTRELVRIGVKAMRIAVDGDWESLKKGELFHGVNEIWEKWWDEA